MPAHYSTLLLIIRATCIILAFFVLGAMWSRQETCFSWLEVVVLYGKTAGRFSHPILVINVFYWHAAVTFIFCLFLSWYMYSIVCLIGSYNISPSLNMYWWRRILLTIFDSPDFFFESYRWVLSGCDLWLVEYQLRLDIFSWPPIVTHINDALALDTNKY